MIRIPDFTHYSDQQVWRFFDKWRDELEELRYKGEDITEALYDLRMSEKAEWKKRKNEQASLVDNKG